MNISSRKPPPTLPRLASPPHSRIRPTPPPSFELVPPQLPLPFQLMTTKEELPRFSPSRTIEPSILPPQEVWEICPRSQANFLRSQRLLLPPTERKSKPISSPRSSPQHLSPWSHRSRRRRPPLSSSRRILLSRIPPSSLLDLLPLLPLRRDLLLLFPSRR